MGKKRSFVFCFYLLPITSNTPACSITQMSSLGDEEYFFDSIRNVTESRRKSRRLKEGEEDVGEAALVPCTSELLYVYD